MNRTTEEAELLRAIHCLNVEVDPSIVKSIEQRAVAAMSSVRVHCAEIAEAMAISGHSVQEPSCIEIGKKIRDELK